MSRIGKQPVKLPKEVKVQLNGNLLLVKGPKGELNFSLESVINLELKEDCLEVKRSNNTKIAKSLHGTARAIINNMVKGVTQGFKKELEIIGVGYKVQMKGKKIDLSIGFSHSVEIAVPEGLTVSLPSNTRITIEGIDKEKVGEFAAKIRRIYPPEPYKGKGIRYLGEEVRKKLGKALAK